MSSVFNSSLSFSLSLCFSLFGFNHFFFFKWTSKIIARIRLPGLSAHQETRTTISMSTLLSQRTSKDAHFCRYGYLHLFEDATVDKILFHLLTRIKVTRITHLQFSNKNGSFKLCFCNLQLRFYRNIFHHFLFFGILKKIKYYVC